MRLDRHDVRLSPFARAIALAAVMLPVAASAQTTGSVTGTVRDAATRAPLVGATVTLRDLADTAARALGDLTDDRGAFAIERVPFGRRLVLETAYVGYGRVAVDTITLAADRPTRDLGDIAMSADAVALDNVTVQAARPDVRVMADKTVYSVESNPTYTATTVSELLAQIPSVQVDPEGKVTLRGDDNVTIMINDRPLNMPVEQRNRFLQSLPSNTVKDIEIRTNPGAQFDAKNSGGIINIVTRRTMSDMLGGMVNGGGDTRGGVNGGGNFYFNGSALTASLGGGVHSGKHGGSNTSMRINYLSDTERRDEGTGASESESGSYHVYGQVDYRLTESDLLSVSGNFNHWGSEYTSTGQRTFFDAAGQIVARSRDVSAPVAGGVGNDGGYRSASFLYKHTFADDHTLGLDVAYDGHGYSGSTEYRNTYFRPDDTIDSLRSTMRRSLYDRTNSTIISSLDYNNPISDALTLSIGAKNEINRLDNSTTVSNLDRTSGEFVPDATQTNHYLPDNAIYAGYANVAYRPLEALSVQAGLRVEHATVSASYASGEPIITRTYTNYFPSGSLAYNITPEHSMTLSYRRSIALPDIEALNPTRIRWNDLYEQSGNPDLEPEFSQSVQLNYNTFWGMGNMISVSPYYKTTEGNIETSQRLENGVTLSTSENFAGSYSIGGELSVSMRPAPWLNFRVGGDLYRKINRGSDLPGDFHSTGTGYDANISLNVDPFEGTTISMNFYVGEPPTVGGSRSGGYTWSSFNIRQRLLDKKLTLSLRVNDPFDLQGWDMVYDTPQFHTETSSKWSSRFVGLNVSYAFGTTPRMEQHTKEKTETKGSGGSSGGGGGTSGGGGQ